MYRRLGAACGSHHELLIARFRLTLKKVGKTSRPFGYDLNQIPYNYAVEVKNRFRGLYLIDTVTKELWMEVCDIVQRIVRRDKKAVLRDQFTEIEENNRMGKTRDLFKKIKDTKGAFHLNIDTIKDRNFTDLTEAEDIKKGWQEYTEELYKKKIFMPR